MIIAARPSLSAAARKTFLSEERRPLFRCSWDRALMVHYAMDPAVLRPLVPFELDLHDGRAYVSLVAFTLGSMRFGFGGPPFATHGFLNVRTYVRHAGEPGIFFLAEWLPNPLCVFMGPRLYGLPYRRGRLDYRHAHEAGSISGRVSSRQGEFRYTAAVPKNADFRACEHGSQDEFLMERYVAFTRRKRTVRKFRVWHPTWKQVRVPVRIEDDRLIESSGGWLRASQRTGANYSPGFLNVWMGFPREVTA